MTQQQRAHDIPADRLAAAMAQKLFTAIVGSSEVLPNTVFGATEQYIDFDQVREAVTRQRHERDGVASDDVEPDYLRDDAREAGYLVGVQVGLRLRGVQ